MREENDRFSIENRKEVRDKEKTLRDQIGTIAYKTTRLPSEFPQTIVSFPSSGFAPDYFSFGTYDFCSERLRDALAQPPDVIDYTPIDLRCDGAKALAQNYQRARIIAVQPGLDLQRSRYDTFEWGDPESGKRGVSITSVDKLVLQEGFKPQTEIFYLAEVPLCLLALDALAGRVLKANCTGLEFRHLDTPDFTNGSGPITVRRPEVGGTRQRA
ncbi:MAG: DUF1629 domain-containing protein [Acetobacteraceae bacterium]